MLPLKYAIERVRGLLAEVKNLKDEDFPYDDSRLALDELENRIRDQLDALTSLSEDNDPNVIKTACNVSLLQHFKLLPLLGFIVRSTNVRNSFEVFGPLRRLARQVLKTDVRLILSSEWLFSPHVYPPLADLPNYVLLGFPASESGNPFLVPLAGHELGHTTWRTMNLENKFGPVILHHILDAAKTRRKDYKNCFDREFDDDLFARQNLGPAHQWSLRQSEESFCDFLGLRLFGTSYLHAFAYLLTPGGTTRVSSYPSLKTRISNLLEAAKKLSITPPDRSFDWFLPDVNPKCTDKDRFLLELADGATKSINSDLLKEAIDISDAASVPTASPEKTNRIKKAFEVLTPAANVGDLTNILAAAWEFYYRTDLWKERKLTDEPVEILKELVLKSIEILEFEEQMRETDDIKG